MSNLFKYETHTHTKEGSACAIWTAKESVHAHKDAGYTGIIVTNHFFYGNTSVPRDLPWTEWVHEFCKGYSLAKEEGDKIGLQVFFGWESGYNGHDFLIYGLDEDWLVNHPEIKDASIEEQHQLISAENGLVVHAHPFRQAKYIKKTELYPDFVDAVEGYNVTHSSPLSKNHKNPEWNTKAIKYAKEHSFHITSGSDSHLIPILNGGMLFDRKLRDINDYICFVRKGTGYRLLTGISGEKLTPEEAFNRV